MSSSDDADSSYEADVSLVAATFSPSQTDNMFYGGNYQGVVASGGWAMDRFAAGASWSYYRVTRNGIDEYGVGDIVVHGQVALLRTADVQAGALFALSVPTGDDTEGFGMGHLMAMPAAYATWRTGRLALSGSAGYSRALFVPSGHVHGMAPLVDPMNMSEITWSGAAEVAIASGIRAGARLAGGLPVGVLPGEDRVIGALRVAWGDRSIDTAAELQAGLSGDPFNVRGVISTALRF